MNQANVLILGVPHTGNHFMLALIPGAAQEHPWPDPSPAGEWVGLMDEAEAVVCPMRHPLLVAKSWKKRGKAITDLDDFWRAQVEIIDRRDPHYITLDRPALRDDQVNAINEDLGLDLNAGDWPVLRDRVIHNATELTDDEYHYVVRHHYAMWASFFGRWYPGAGIRE